MKQEDLMKAMNGADDALLEDAHVPTRKRRVLPKVLIAAAVAAALTVTAAAAGLFGVRLFTNGQSKLCCARTDFATTNPAARHGTAT